MKTDYSTIPTGDQRSHGEFWASTHPLMPMYEKVHALIPIAGDVKDKGPALERFRKITNAYYNLFNNGRSSPYFRQNLGNGLSRKLSPDHVLAQALEAAYREQFVPTTEIVS